MRCGANTFLLSKYVISSGVTRNSGTTGQIFKSSSPSPFHTLSPLPLSPSPNSPSPSNPPFSSLPSLPFTPFYSLPFRPSLLLPTLSLSLPPLPLITAIHLAWLWCNLVQVVLLKFATEEYKCFTSLVWCLYTICRNLEFAFCVNSDGDKSVSKFSFI